MQFSIRTLLLFTTGVAITVASLRFANTIVGDLFYTLGLLTIAFAVLAAIYRRGPQRAFWVGFVVLFAGYFCHTVWPSEVRGTWTLMQRMGSLGVSKSEISTTRLLNAAFETLPGPAALPYTGTTYNYNPRSPRANQTANQYMNFMTIGHTSIAFLFGVLGGVVAQRFATRSMSRNAPITENPT
jgi:hypothetical protein